MRSCAAAGRGPGWPSSDHAEHQAEAQSGENDQHRPDGQQQVACAEARGAGAHREHDGDDDVRHQQTDGEPEADVAVEAGDEGQEGPAPAQQHDDADHQTQQQQRPTRGVASVASARAGRAVVATATDRRTGRRATKSGLLIDQ